MKKIIPDMYQKDIFSVNYKKLKDKGIKLLVYDFDNTIIDKYKTLDKEKLKKLFTKLKKDFEVIVLSNTLKPNKIDAYCNYLGIKYMMGAKKPFKSGYLKIMEKYKCKDNEIACLGDQLLTDIWGAKRMNIYSILVDPIGKDDTSFTIINRIIEKFVYKNLNKKYKFEKGKYYD